MPARWDGLVDAQTPFQKMPYRPARDRAARLRLLAEAAALAHRAGRRADRRVARGARRRARRSPRSASRRRPPATGKGRQVNLDLHLLLPEILVVATALAVRDGRHPRRAGDAPPAPRAGDGRARARRRAPRAPARPSRRARAVFGHFTVDAFAPLHAHDRRRGRAARSSRSPRRTRARMDRGHGEFYALLLFALTGVHARRRASPT